MDFIKQNKLLTFCISLSILAFILIIFIGTEYNVLWSFVVILFIIFYVLVIYFIGQLIHLNDDRKKVKSILTPFKTVNDDISLYFDDIISKYGFKVIKIDDFSTALVKDNFAIHIIFKVLDLELHYSDIDIVYIFRDSNNKLIKLDFHYYLINKCLHDLRVDNVIDIYDEQKEIELNKVNRRSFLKSLDDEKNIEYHFNINNDNIKTSLNDETLERNIKLKLFVLNSIHMTLNDHWENILEGDQSWIDDYNNSIWCTNSTKIERKYKNKLNHYI